MLIMHVICKSNRLSQFHSSFLRSNKILINKYRKLCMTHLKNDVIIDNDNKNKHNLTLMDTYSKTKKLLTINGNAIKLNYNANKYMTMYCCGPTVYDDCHIGHALAYIRCDILRRVLQKYCGIRILMAMGITDIDDKILTKAAETNARDFRSIGSYYMGSFMRDIEALNILPADCYLKVTDHIDDIIEFIRQMHANKFAYISDVSGDVNFDSQYFSQFYGIEKLWDTIELTESELRMIGKRSVKDFVLWKGSKPNEPSWDYVAPDGSVVKGRPGWHVECSTIATRVFGKSIDIHWGGSDLIFPHHHCESLCIYSYQNLLENPKSVYQWCNHWLHSGHLIFNSEKMSKSLGNSISIKQFLSENTSNILRLLCIQYHYRRDVHYDNELLNSAVNCERKLRNFYEEINANIKRMSLNSKHTVHDRDTNFSAEIQYVENEIIEGIADDLDLNRGLEALLKLYDELNSCASYTLFDLLIIKSIVGKWFDTMGLTHRGRTVNEDQNSRTFNEDVVSDLLVKFRFDVREIALKNLYLSKNPSKINKSDNTKYLESDAKTLLSHCDKLRNDLNDYGIQLKDISIGSILDKSRHS